MQMCIARDAELTASMRDFRDGKWSGMELESHIGFVNWNDEDWRYPVQHVVTLPKKSRLVVSRTDDTRSYTNQYFPITLEINDFLYPGNDEVLCRSQMAELAAYAGIFRRAASTWSFPKLPAAQSILKMW